MLMLTRMGAVVAPPVPPFYARPATLDDMIREMAARDLNGAFRLHAELFPEGGPASRSALR